jgi:hypothetical protein
MQATSQAGVEGPSVCPLFIRIEILPRGSRLKFRYSGLLADDRYRGNILRGEIEPKKLSGQAFIEAVGQHL